MEATSQSRQLTTRHIVLHAFTCVSSHEELDGYYRTSLEYEWGRMNTGCMEADVVYQKSTGVSQARLSIFDKQKTTTTMCVMSLDVPAFLFA